jgi:hypothetical protein
MWATQCRQTVVSSCLRTGCVADVQQHVIAMYINPEAF